MMATVMKSLFKWRCLLLFFCAVALVVLSLFNPRWPMSQTIYHYAFFIDISQSMNTRDYLIEQKVYDRLAVSKRAVRAAVRRLPCGSTVSLGLFTSNNSYQLFNPLDVCAHYSVIDQVLNNISWRMAWANDSKIQYGLFAALALLNDIDQDSKLVFLSDGDQSPVSERRPNFMGQPGVPGGTIVGVGGLQPAPVPHLDENNNIADYWTLGEALGLSPSDPKALQHYYSHLDEGNLRRLASVTGMGYFRLTDPEEFGAQLQAQDLGVTQVVEADIRWLLAGLALLLLILSSVKLTKRATD